MPLLLGTPDAKTIQVRTKKVKGSILIVEDHANEKLLIKNAFEEFQVTDAVHAVNNGEEAIAYLRGDGRFRDRQKYPFPTFLLTGLDMPKVSGFELLLFIKRSKLIIIPVIVLSASTNPHDLHRAYLFGANAFHVKPPHMEGLVQVLRRIYKYWAQVETPEVDEFGNLKSAHKRPGEKIRPVIGHAV